jgi:predicted transcriptional regulator YdeE
MKPKIVELPSVDIIGIKTRTSHQQEAKQETANIPHLWQRFYQEGIEDKISDKALPPLLYEVYCDYSGDSYSVVIGIKVNSLRQVPSGLVGITLPSGRYEQFEATGEMPHAIQKSWRDIHNYYSAESAPIRAFQYDFEVLHRDAAGDITKADIYVAFV